MSSSTNRTSLRASLALALAAIVLLAPAARADTAEERFQKAGELISAKKFPEARKELEAAIKLDPKHVPSRRVLGSLLRAENLPEAAAKHLEVAAENASDDDRTNATLECANAWCAAAQKVATTGEGSVKKRNDLCEKAILWYGRVLALDPALDGVVLNKGTMQCLAEKWAEAQATLEGYLEKHPDDESALFNLARCLEETEAAPFAKAIAAWERYVEVAKSEPKRKGDIDYAKARIKALKKGEKKKK